MSKSRRFRPKTQNQFQENPETHHNSPQMPRSTFIHN
jgi:hypothetical protein